MREQFPPIKINFTPVKVAGAAAVPLLIVVGGIAFVFPVAAWLLVLGTLGGVLFALAKILVRRRRDADPGDHSPTLLYPGLHDSVPEREGRAGGAGGVLMDLPVLT